MITLPSAEPLIERVEASLGPEAAATVRRAYAFAAQAHAGQRRLSGDPYIVHPLEVATILAELQLDEVTLCAALLHDVVEDTQVTLDEIRQNFGNDVALIVDGVTKLGKLNFSSKAEAQAENTRKMFVAIAKDIRVLLVKLADRLHNMRTLRYLPRHKQISIARETLEIFAPLAHRLGMANVKWELEDLALRYLDPPQYYRIANQVMEKRTEREAHVEEAIRLLRSKLEEAGLQADVSGRPKHIYSIYHKMVTQHKALNEIYDLLAVRVIVESLRDCYAVLGMVHALWKPIPGRFKDYIAAPKPNGYQSIHTTVVGPKGVPLEIQIRTWEMHRTAEYGIAAHWRYKEGNRAPDELDQKFSWFREILEWQQDFADAQEFMDSLKIDLFSDKVLVFTPKGDIVELPAHAVPIDFAYHIHTEVGNHCVGAKVNGKMVSLDTELHTGDIVEILTSKQSYGPSRDWLKIAKSSQAKSRIRQWFKREARESNIVRGREEIHAELRKVGIDASSVPDEVWQDLFKHLNVHTMDDLCAAVGYDGIKAERVASRIAEKLQPAKAEKALPKLAPEPPHKTGKGGHGVRVAGEDDLFVRLSHCCNPIPGDEIIGFITRGRGVSIHRADCPNIVSLPDKERLVATSWVNDPQLWYYIDLQVTALDHSGILREVIDAVAETRTQVKLVNGRVDKQHLAVIDMTLAIRNKEHLSKVVERIKHVPDVYTVERVTQ